MDHLLEELTAEKTDTWKGSRLVGMMVVQMARQMGVQTAVQ